MNIGRTRVINVTVDRAVDLADLQAPVGTEWEIIEAYGSHEVVLGSDCQWQLYDVVSGNIIWRTPLQTALAQSITLPFAQMVNAAVPLWLPIKGVVLQRGLLLRFYTATATNLNTIVAIVMERPERYIEKILGDVYDLMKRRLPVADVPDRTHRND